MFDSSIDFMINHPIRKSHPLIKIINSSLIDLPAPINISIWWNYGSILGLFLVIQIITGLFLAIHYIPNIDIAFISLTHINRNVNFGWILHLSHINGASLFFLFIYLHIARGLYYNSFFIIETWNIGVIIFILTMATAFMGYVLPWGQMRFWGATVITNIFSAIPYLGQSLVEWIWGGFAVSNATLNRFFAIHFILPFILVGLAIIHLLFLHQSGSNNPLGLTSFSDRIPFHHYFTSKDILGYIIVIFIFILIIIFTPNIFADPENFINANPLVTPTHIQPEWYFLWLYAILRSIPNKLGGVVALLIALIILFLPPFTIIYNKLRISFYPINQIIFWLMSMSWLILTWIGRCQVEEPYIIIGQLSTILYFLYFITSPIIIYIWDKVLLLNIKLLSERQMAPIC